MICIHPGGSASELARPFAGIKLEKGPSLALSSIAADKTELPEGI